MKRYVLEVEEEGYRQIQRLIQNDVKRRKAQMKKWAIENGKDSKTCTLRKGPPDIKELEVKIGGESKKETAPKTSSFKDYVSPEIYQLANQFLEHLQKNDPAMGRLVGTITELFQGAGKTVSKEETINTLKKINLEDLDKEVEDGLFEAVESGLVEEIEASLEDDPILSDIGTLFLETADIEERIDRERIACAYAARKGSLTLLQAFRSEGFLWDERTPTEAAMNGHLEILKWILEQESTPCYVSPWITAYAAGAGHLSVIEYLVEKGCPINENTCAYAARGGHLYILKWLRSQDPPCAWNGDTCMYAVKGGHLDIVKWLHLQRFPWSQWTKEGCLKEAEERGHQDVVEWLKEHVVPT